MKKTLQVILPIGIGVALIYFSYTSFTAEDRDLIMDQIKASDPWLVAASMVLALLSHLSRAYRWNFMLEELGHKPRFINNVVAIGTGYAVNLIIPRGGEIARAGVVKKTDKIPLDQSLGTIIAERALDFIILLLVLATALLTARDEFQLFMKGQLEALLEKLDAGNIFLIAGGLLLLAFAVFFLLKKLRALDKIAGILKGIKDGFMTIWTMKKKIPYLLHTVFIWGMYVLMFYVCSLSLPDTGALSLAAILCAFVGGSFAVALTNGGLGAYPLFVAQTLLLFNVPEATGTSLGWVLWISQTLLVILYGLASLSYLSLQKL